MRASFIGNFSVRHYECDVQGHMYAPNYIALAEESAYETLSGEASTPTNRRWLPQALYARHRSSLRAQDTAELMSEISYDLDSQLICRCTIADGRTGEEAAYIEAQWVMSDTEETGGIPIVAASSGLAESERSGDRQLSKAEQLSLPNRAEQPVAFARKVEVRDVGRSRTATFKALADYMVEAGVRGAEEFGWPLDRVREAGIGFFIREQWIRCFRGTSFRDELDITTWVSNLKRVSAIRNYEIRNAAKSEPSVQAQTIWACVDITSGAPAKIPNEFVADIWPHISE